MSDKTHVDPAELRASAGACDDIAQTMKGPADKAVRETGTASGSLTGWSMGAALGEIATSWQPALDGLHSRLRAGGDNLRSSARGHEWNDERTSRDFEGTDTGTAARSTPGEMPAALRPGPGGSHPTGHPDGPADVAPIGRTSGDGLPDPHTTQHTNMPTYDEGVGTRPTPGTNDFG